MPFGCFTRLCGSSPRMSRRTTTGSQRPGKDWHQGLAPGGVPPACRARLALRNPPTGMSRVQRELRALIEAEMDTTAQAAALLAAGHRSGEVQSELGIRALEWQAILDRLRLTVGSPGWIP